MAKKIILREVPDDRNRSAGPPAPPARPAADILAEIRSLYFKTTARTIEQDFDRAIDLLKRLPTVDDRQRATVYMEGLAEMRKEWGRKRRRAEAAAAPPKKKPRR